jgi:inner membrane protein
VDNITHTLVGAALAEAGLGKRTALGAATLMIGANFPDIDVAGLISPNSIDIRRGITHGFPALAILPFALAWLMYQYDRRVRLRRHPGEKPADMRQLVLLSALSIWTHPVLDFMNIYGMRWLMPVVNRWYYADALFIVDVWILLALGVSVMWSRRRRTPLPARVALAATSAYVVIMLGITELGRRAFAEEYRFHRYMVGPTALSPWSREILADAGFEYRFGTYTPWGGARLGDAAITVGDTADPTVVAARAAPEARGFLNWARFPFYRISRTDSGTVVRIADARYVGPSGFGWASVLVRLP